MTPESILNINAYVDVGGRGVHAMCTAVFCPHTFLDGGGRGLSFGLFRAVRLAALRPSRHLVGLLRPLAMALEVLVVVAVATIAVVAVLVSIVVHLLGASPKLMWPGAVVAAPRVHYRQSSACLIRYDYY